jgi:hypothetical protein
VACRVIHPRAQSSGNNPSPCCFHGELRHLAVPALDVFRNAQGHTRELVTPSTHLHFRRRLVCREGVGRPARFSGRTIALASDELSVSEIVEIYRKVTGRAEKPFPIPRFLPRLTLPSDICRACSIGSRKMDTTRTSTRSGKSTRNYYPSHPG